MTTWVQLPFTCEDARSVMSVREEVRKWRNRPLASHPVLTDVHYKLQRATQRDATSLFLILSTQLQII